MSEPGVPFLSVTAHYIDSLDGKPQEWELKSEQLAFTIINSNHSGSNIGQILIETINNYNFHTKAVAFTIDPSGKDWIAGKHHVHCMEHALHLAVKHFIEDVYPTPASILIRNKTNEDDNNEVTNEVDNDEVTNFNVTNTMGKALALVWKSPQACTFFHKCCAAVNEPNLKLLKWIHTRWALFFAILECTLKLCKGVNRFIQLIDDSDKVPNLQSKTYGAFKLLAKECKKLELMHNMLQESANAQQSFSATHEPTVWHTIPVLKFLQQTWQNIARSLKFNDFSTAINSSINNLHKWYHKINETDVYFICLALDPNYKVAYAKSKWEPCDFDKDMRRLQNVFNTYYHCGSLPNAEPVVAAPSSLTHQGLYGHKLKDYLASPLKDIENIVAWWGHHFIQYPNISRIPKDYLAIQGSTVASE
ncbi:hypothetical protein CY34DRAFT_13821 [Suillus luteus UH-Slu-Lm8-n1]|uniref:HAT C-terminal dimerisation domain-containing protein n=1 Tax=Suillus luteus UH-Slu-Lm8-n1 TaxID=930992 RepID=A0A0D0B961_9AGAM|nr:hypothetical protein CY34DRAFT_13821 [Suillus luteus UH-Slu-Lm8-n1]